MSQPAPANAESASTQGAESGNDPAAVPASSPFADLAAFVALPRVGALALSPDGRRLAISVQTLDGKPLPAGVAQHLFVSALDEELTPLEAAPLV